MIEVRYFNLLELSRESFDAFLPTLPAILAEEINSYKFFPDKAARLIARLLVRVAIIETGYMPEILTSWQKDKNDRPFIIGWMPFNISHSKDLVVVAFSRDSEIGIDIENTDVKLDAPSLLSYFCYEEQELIRHSAHPQETFLEIWVKKEAVLKASGIGISNGLNQIDCRSDIVNYAQQRWFLQKIEINNKYICYLAINNANSPVNIREIYCQDLNYPTP